MSVARLRFAMAFAACLAVGPAAGQQASAAARLLESPECGPARPGCKLSPGARRQAIRQARLETLRDASEAMSAGPVQQAHAAPLAVPTPEDQIQPAYRDHGTVRPEFSQSGTALR